MGAVRFGMKNCFELDVLLKSGNLLKVVFSWIEIVPWGLMDHSFWGLQVYAIDVV